MGATELDTLPILGSLHNTLRAWKNPAALQVASLEAGQGELSEILSIVAGSETERMYREGDVDAGVIACSQGIGIVEKIEAVGDVIAEMVGSAEMIRDRLVVRET